LAIKRSADRKSTSRGNRSELSNNAEGKLRHIVCPHRKKSLVAYVMVRCRRRARATGVRALAGDAVGSGNVTVSDVVLTKTKAGADVGVNARYDMDLSGTTDVSDVEFAKVAVASPAREALSP
jgi:hypothetical protein